MIDLLGTLGVLVAFVGAILIFTAMNGMTRLVNSTRPTDLQYKGFFLLPAVSGPVRKAFRIEYPNNPLQKRLQLGLYLILGGMAVTIACNSLNAHRS